MKLLREDVTGLAPVAIFGFNRPEHLLNCLRSLEANLEARDTDVYIFLDGPRSEVDTEAVKSTREVARERYKFKSITIAEQNTNLGLGKSIITGIDKVFETNKRLIVLEDDLIVSIYFLSFMNIALTKYEKEKKVGSIHAFNFNFEQPLDEPYFIRGGDCLGWATWSDRWEMFTPNSANTYEKLRKSNLIKEFDLGGSFRYSQILKNEIRDGFHSWAINWHASLFVNGCLTLYPGTSLIEYRGADGSGTHEVKNSDLWSTKMSTKSEWNFPLRIDESKAGLSQLKKYYEKTYPSRNPLSKIVNWLRYIIIK
jgi:hypothetical protein